VRSTFVLASVLLAAACAQEPAASLRCPEGTSLERDASESWCQLPDGTRHGPTWGHYANGTLRFYGVAERGLQQGPWQMWHPNGVKSVEGEYRDGVLVGPFRMWSREGHLLYSGQHDERGRMTGEWTRWWENGQLRMKWEMHQGQHHGRVDAWYESGARRMRGERREDRRHGFWQFWDEDGRLRSTCRYEQGDLVEGDCDPAGRAHTPTRSEVRKHLPRAFVP
jgi:antitoxin component YwqK of YwqJK toxin-antitoxin module